ncbi:MAG: hypothetical protein P4M12_06235 [Gammaproteobacteria bacterium]|nr:hypothetical protein [Gammaproteobacteria bacterium]
MRIAILQFPTSNCEPEMALAIEKANMQPINFSEPKMLTQLSGCDGTLILDYFNDSLLFEILQEQNLEGKPILGLGDGARTLVAAGLVPGVGENEVCVDITPYSSDSALSHIRLIEDYQYNAFTRLTSLKILRVEATHQFQMPIGLLKEIQIQGMDVFHYCSADGTLQENIAALANKVGNVMAVAAKFNQPQHLEILFRSMHDYFVAGHTQDVTPLFYFPRFLK